MDYLRLKMEVEKAGYTQKEFGTKIGYSKNGINNLMNGHTKMDIVVANLIVDALEITNKETLMDIFFLVYPTSEI